MTLAHPVVVDQDGIFDEIAVGGWLHIELLDDGEKCKRPAVYWVKIANMTGYVTIERDGTVQCMLEPDPE